jgi:hypothetical protein
MDSWEVVVEETTVTATFVGHLSADEGRKSALAFAEELQKHELVDVVFDVTNMEGYDRGARTQWQLIVHPHRDRILGIHLIGGSRIIRMGASVLAMVLGVPLRTD